VLSGNIFLTGGTGSLGKAILERASMEKWPAKFTVYSRDEVKQSELRAIYPKVKFLLGDVRDYEWLNIAMRGHDTVIHAGAYKQVPAAEVNAGEAIETNVIGSRNVVRAAITNGVGQVLGISTDKACAPINCYGETKALMEKLFQQANLLSDTKFTLVRYGNVLGSRGSVVPLFRKQVQQGKITLTDPNMTRFWLTLTDAVDLVIGGLALGMCRGDILIPKAKASTMLMLANVIGPDCPVEIIGIRPGEKINECLVHGGESMHTLEFKDGFIIKPAYTAYKGNLAAGYEYTSDNAIQLKREELSKMVEGS
jgi:UDP-N-acetylglucosamine 4,6-dehydratase